MRLFCKCWPVSLIGFSLSRDYSPNPTRHCVARRQQCRCSLNISSQIPLHTMYGTTLIRCEDQYSVPYTVLVLVCLKCELPQSTCVV